ncbi:MAG: hypothetical protein IJT82_01965 [Schwartzia sp.]|nr:hypothetical protein [Schwartzia sp. (in: firmicutes)]
MKGWIKKSIAAAFSAALIGMGAPEASALNVSQDVPPDLTLVAQSDFQWAGLTISPRGRFFVCFPEWGVHPEFKLAELVNGVTVPFPSDEMQGSFANVQSISCDKENMLWVLDAAKVPGEPSAPSAVKLCRVDIDMGTVMDTYTFNADVILPDTYLNDFRIDLDSSTAYITDSGHGGIILLDLSTGESYRALTDIVEVRANLQSIYFPTTGMFSRLEHSDGLELSNDKKTLYFASLGGDRVYGVPTAALKNRALSMDERKKAVREITLDGAPSDGMVIRGDYLYMGDLADEGILELDTTLAGKKEAGAILNLGKDVRWASSFALGLDGSIYFTTSAENYPIDQQKPYELYKMSWTKKSDPMKIKDTPVPFYGN